MKKVVIPIILLSLFTSCASMPSVNEHIAMEQSSQNFPGMQFGVCHGGYSKTDREYELMDKLGIRWVRADFAWDRMESSQGEWDFSYYDDFLEKAEQEGVKVLAILDYDARWLHGGEKKEFYISPENLPHFLNYVEVVAERYGDRVGAFEIWNEPNSFHFWTGKDRDFFDLTLQSLDVLDRVSPDTPVAVGSLYYSPLLRSATYIKKMIKAGIFEKADALSLHPYAMTPEIAVRRMYQARKILDDGGYDTPIWITEAGFTTGGHYPHTVSLDEHAEVTAKTMAGLGAAGVEMITWYCLFDKKNPEDVVPGTSAEAFFGLVWPDYRWKPAAYPFSVLANELAGYRYVPEVYPFEVAGSDSIYQAQFEGPDGKKKVVIWSEKNKVNYLDLAEIDSDIQLIDLNSAQKIEPVDTSSVFVGSDPILLILSPR